MIRQRPVIAMHVVSTAWIELDSIPTLKSYIRVPIYVDSSPEFESENRVQDSNKVRLWNTSSVFKILILIYFLWLYQFVCRRFELKNGIYLFYCLKSLNLSELNIITKKYNKLKLFISGAINLTFYKINKYSYFSSLFTYKFVFLFYINLIIILPWFQSRQLSQTSEWIIYYN